MNFFQFDFYFNEDKIKFIDSNVIYLKFMKDCLKKEANQ